MDQLPVEQDINGGKILDEDLSNNNGNGYYKDKADLNDFRNDDDYNNNDYSGNGFNPNGIDKHREELLHAPSKSKEMSFEKSGVLTYRRDSLINQKRDLDDEVQRLKDKLERKREESRNKSMMSNRSNRSSTPLKKRNSKALIEQIEK